MPGNADRPVICSPLTSAFFRALFPMYDLLIRAGTIVDGSGAKPLTGDVAVENGRIVAVGRVQGAARRTLDADGLLISPGVVDIHTHYDGQATWDPLLTPSCWHGVTTAVMGNCGVGFAPMKSERRQFLIELMEGVEDIPGAVLAEGVDWGWESFPEYLDVLAAKPRGMDLGAQLPHSALRYYVKGERGAAREPANADDLQRRPSSPSKRSALARLDSPPRARSCTR